MQGLSSRAHAFSVEALVGKPCKRMKLTEEHESSSAGDTGSDTSILTGEEANGQLGDYFMTLLMYTHFTHEMEQCSLRFAAFSCFAPSVLNDPFLRLTISQLNLIYVIVSS